MTGFAGALGVVRVQIAPEVYLSALPQPIGAAKEYVAALAEAIERAGDTARLVAFDAGTGLDYLIRARDVMTVDVVATEDPSA